MPVLPISATYIELRISFEKEILIKKTSMKIELKVNSNSIFDYN